MGFAPSAFEDEASAMVADLLARRRGGTITDLDLDLLLQAIEAEAEDWSDWWDEAGTEVECPPIVPRLIEEARDLLRHGRQDDAIARLEKCAFPKWSSEQECRAAYDAHMAAQRATNPTAPGDVP